MSGTYYEQEEKQLEVIGRIIVAVEESLRIDAGIEMQEGVTK